MQLINYLFSHFEAFIVVYFITIADAILAVIKAGFKGFERKHFLSFLAKLIEYTIYLCFGNLVEYFSNKAGFDLQIEGIPTSAYAVAAAIMAVEIASLKEKFKLKV